MADKVTMSPLLHANMKATTGLYDNCLSANVYSDPIPNTIARSCDPKSGQGILGPGDVNNGKIK